MMIMNIGIILIEQSREFESRKRRQQTITCGMSM